MVTLKKQQVEYIEQDVKNRGVFYQPLQDDIIDHICSAVEFEMEQGTKFMDAYKKVMKEFGPEGIESTNHQTINHLNSVSMYKNYLLVAFRNIKRRKIYSIVNIGGLALGIAACLLIIEYIRFERSYDTYHEHADNIYRIRVDVEKPGNKPSRFAVSFPSVGPTMLADLPEVTNYTRMNKLAAIGVLSHEKNGALIKFKQDRMYYADSSFFKIFSYKMLQGDKNTIFSDPNTCVLTESTARKYFGNEDPIGKIMVRNGRQEFKVTGITEDVPENSHLKYDVLLSYQTLINGTRHGGGDISHADVGWGWWDFYTYIQLDPSTDLAEFDKKVESFVERYRGDFDKKRGVKTSFILQPLQDIHLSSNVGYEFEPNGNKKSINTMFIIAIFIIVIAWLNYINLSTSHSMDRAKEVGVRKVIGSYRSQLIRQFLTESLLINFCAALIALGLVFIAIPYFNELTARDFKFDILQDILFLLGFIVVTVIGAVLSGLYPAFVLSAFKPAVVLKGKMSASGQGKTLRQVLVVFQFTASISLIVGTYAIYKQTNFMMNRELGFDLEQTLVVNGPWVRDSTFRSHLEEYRQAMVSHHSVKGFGTSSDVPGKEVEWSNGFWFKGTSAEQSLGIRMLGMDEHFIENYGLEIIAGRNFSKSSQDAFNKSIIINETVLKQLNSDLTPTESIGKVLLNDSDTLEIVGVVKDYYHRSLKVETEPVMYRCSDAWSGFFTIKMNTNDEPLKTSSELIALAEQTWNKTFYKSPFSYFFLDDFYNNQYQTEVKFGKVFTLFSLMAIIVACLGLFGLSSFTVLQRHKEIGVRKVLGATISQVLILLSKDFAKLIFVGSLLATPLSYYFINLWLMEFPERINLSVWIFLLPIFVVIAVALFTVSYQTLRAAFSNPVKTLRYE